MNYHDKEPEEIPVEEALRNFRTSIHAWSDQELHTRPFRVEVAKAARPHLHWLMVPAMGWAMAGILAIGAIGVPVAVHHERQVAAEQLAAQQQQQRETQEKAAQQAPKTANNDVDDEELLNHVDSDIAQAAPDAMEPLASLMQDSNARDTGTGEPTTR